MPLKHRGKEATFALVGRRVRLNKDLQRKWHLICILKDGWKFSRKTGMKGPLSEGAKPAKAQGAKDDEVLTKGPVVT